MQRVKSETTDSDGDTIKQIYWRIRVGKQVLKTFGFLLVLSVGIPDYFHRVKQEASMSDHLGLINKQCRLKVMVTAQLPK